MGIEIILVVLVSICVVLWMTHLSQRVSELRGSIERRSSVPDEIHSFVLRAEQQRVDILSKLCEQTDKLEALSEAMVAQTQTVAEIVPLLGQLAADTAEIKKSLPKCNAKGQFVKNG